MARRKSPTVLKSLRIHAPLDRAIQDAAEASGRDYSALANELLAESVKMRRCPGVVFADGPAGRRARIAGTGLEVWEVAAGYESLKRSWPRLRRALDWLTEAQLRAAIGYYAAYPDEVKAQISRNEAWSAERLRAEHPALSPDLP